MEKNRRFAFFLVVMAGVLWGCLGFFFRHLSAYGFGSIDVVLFRLAFSSVILFVILMIKDRSLFRIRFKDLWCLCGTGFVMVLMIWLYFSSMNYITVALAGVLNFTSPVFVLFLSALFFKEKITRKKLFALVMVFSGCVFCSGLLGGSQEVSALGFILGVLSGLGYGFYNIFCRFCLNRGYNGFTVTFYSMTSGALLCLFLVDLPAIASHMTPPAFCWAIGVAVCCALLPYLCYSTGMMNIDTGEAALMTAIEPVVAATISVVILSEPMSISIAIGILLVICGILYMSHAPKKQR